MSTQHTPGPCAYCGTDKVNTGSPIWEDYCPNKDCKGEAEAFKSALQSTHKAHLKAERIRDAAPDLLGALTWFINDIDGTSTKMTEFDAAVARARAAIAKAEGQS